MLINPMSIFSKYNKVPFNILFFYLFLFLSICFSISLFILTLSSGELSQFIANNKIDPDFRNRAFFIILLTMLTGFVSAIVYLAVTNKKNALQSFFIFLKRISPLCLLFTIPVLLSRDSFKGKEFFHLTLIISVGLIFYKLMQLSSETFNERYKISIPIASLSEKGKWIKFLPEIILVFITVFFAVLLAYFTVQQHYHLHTSSYDLGIFDNLMYNLIHGERLFLSTPFAGPEYSHFSHHATFIAYLFAPIYALRQSADTLLIIQALLVAFSTLPLYKLSLIKVGNKWIALCIALCFVLFVPLQSPVFYDFHFIFIAQFFILWTIYFLDKNSRIGLTIFTILSIASREDISIALFFVGVFYFINQKNKKTAFIFSLVCLSYFILMKFVVMPSFSEGRESFLSYYNGLFLEGDSGLFSVIMTILTNPFFILKHLFNEQKAVYVLHLMGPFLFFSIKYRWSWLLFVSGFLFTLITPYYKPLFQISFQYTAHWTPYLFLGFIYYLSQIKQNTKRLISTVVSVLLVSLLISYNYGFLFQRSNFKGGFRTVDFTMDSTDKMNYQDFRELAAYIPNEADVIATEQLVPHLSNRKNCYTLRIGNWDAEYIIADLREFSRNVQSRENMSKALEKGAYGFVQSKGNFILWKKGYATENNNIGKMLIYRNR